MPKVINISAVEAESIQRLRDNECLISIHNTTNPDWNLQVSGEKVFKVYFDDVPVRLTQNGLTYNPISIENAHQILNFINQWDGYDFIVNCHAGIARSGAVSLALHILYGYELKPNFFQLSESNTIVLGTLINEFYKIKNKVYNL